MMKRTRVIIGILLVMVWACFAATSAEISGQEAIQLMQAGKVKESIEAFEKLAAKDDTRAMVQLGVFYHEGDELTHDSYTFITGMGLSSGPVKKDQLTKTAEGLVFEDSHTIVGSPKRYISLEGEDATCLVYELKHPTKPKPTGWSSWQRPDFALKDGMEIFSLMQGGEPKSKTHELPATAPLVRFKVVKD